VPRLHDAAGIGASIGRRFRTDRFPHANEVIDRR